MPHRGSSSRQPRSPASPASGSGYASRSHDRIQSIFGLKSSNPDKIKDDLSTDVDPPPPTQLRQPPLQASQQQQQQPKRQPPLSHPQSTRPVSMSGTRKPPPLPWEVLPLPDSTSHQLPLVILNNNDTVPRIEDLRGRHKSRSKSPVNRDSKPCWNPRCPDPPVFFASGIGHPFSPHSDRPIEKRSPIQSYTTDNGSDNEGKSPLSYPISKSPVRVVRHHPASRISELVLSSDSIPQDSVPSNNDTNVSTINNNKSNERGSSVSAETLPAPPPPSSVETVIGPPRGSPTRTVILYSPSGESSVLRGPDDHLHLNNYDSNNNNDNNTSNDERSSDLSSSLNLTPLSVDSHPSSPKVSRLGVISSSNKQLTNESTPMIDESAIENSIVKDISSSNDDTVCENCFLLSEMLLQLQATNEELTNDSKQLGDNLRSSAVIEFFERLINELNSLIDDNGVFKLNDSKTETKLLKNIGKIKTDIYVILKQFLNMHTSRVKTLLMNWMGLCRTLLSSFLLLSNECQLLREQYLANPMLNQGDSSPSRERSPHRRRSSLSPSPALLDDEHDLEVIRLHSQIRQLQRELDLVDVTNARIESENRILLTKLRKINENRQSSESPSTEERDGLLASINDKVEEDKYKEMIEANDKLKLELYILEVEVDKLSSQDIKTMSRYSNDLLQQNSEANLEEYNQTISRSDLDNASSSSVFKPSPLQQSMSEATNSSSTIPLMEELVQLRAEVEILRYQLSQFTDNLQYEKSEVSTLTCLSKQSDEEITRLLNELSSINELYTKRLDVQVNDIASLSQQLSNANDDNSNLRRELFILKNNQRNNGQNTNSDNNNRTKDAKLESLAQELLDAQMKCSSLNVKVQNLTQNESNLYLLINQKSLDISTLKSDVLKSRDDCQNKENDVIRQQGVCDDLNNIIVKYKQRVSELMEQLEKRDIVSNHQRSELESVKSDLALFKNNYNRLKSSQESIREASLVVSSQNVDDLSLTVQELARCRNECLSLQLELTDEQKNTQELSSICKKLQSDVSDITEVLDKRDIELNKLQEQCLDYSQQITDKSQANIKLKHEVEVGEILIKQLQGRVRSLEESVEDVVAMEQELVILTRPSSLTDMLYVSNSKIHPAGFNEDSNCRNIVGGTSVEPRFVSDTVSIPQNGLERVKLENSHMKQLISTLETKVALNNSNNLDQNSIIKSPDNSGVVDGKNSMQQELLYASKTELKNASDEKKILELEIARLSSIISTTGRNVYPKSGSVEECARLEKENEYLRKQARLFEESLDSLTLEFLNVREQISSMELLSEERNVAIVERDTILKTCQGLRNEINELTDFNNNVEMSNSQLIEKLAVEESKNSILFEKIDYLNKKDQEQKNDNVIMSNELNNTQNIMIAYKEKMMDTVKNSYQISYGVYSSCCLTLQQLSDKINETRKQVDINCENVSKNIKSFRAFTNGLTGIYSDMEESYVEILSKLMNELSKERKRCDNLTQSILDASLSSSTIHDATNAAEFRLQTVEVGLNSLSKQISQLNTDLKDFCCSLKKNDAQDVLSTSINSLSESRRRVPDMLTPNQSLKDTDVTKSHLQQCNEYATMWKNAENEANMTRLQVSELTQRCWELESLLGCLSNYETDGETLASFKNKYIRENQQRKELEELLRISENKLQNVVLLAEHLQSEFEIERAHRHRMNVDREVYEISDRLACQALEEAKSIEVTSALVKSLQHRLVEAEVALDREKQNRLETFFDILTEVKRNTNEITAAYHLLSNSENKHFNEHENRIISVKDALVNQKCQVFNLTKYISTWASKLINEQSNNLVKEEMLNAGFERLKALQSNIETQQTELNIERNNMKVEQEQLQNRLNEVDSILNNVKSQKLRLDEDIKVFNNDRNELILSKKLFETERSQLLKQVDLEVSERRRAMEMINLSRHARQQCETETEIIQNQLENLQVTCMTLESSNAQLLSELKSEKSVRISIENTLSNACGKLDTLSQLITQYEEENSVLSTSLNSAKNDISELIMERNNLKHDCERLQIELNKVTKTISDYQISVDDANEEANWAKSQFQALTSENRKLTDQNSEILVLMKNLQVEHAISLEQVSSDAALRQHQQGYQSLMSDAEYTSKLRNVHDKENELNNALRDVTEREQSWRDEQQKILLSIDQTKDELEHHALEIFNQRKECHQRREILREGMERHRLDVSKDREQIERRRCEAEDLLSKALNLDSILQMKLHSILKKETEISSLYDTLNQERVMIRLLEQRLQEKMERVSKIEYEAAMSQNSALDHPLSSVSVDQALHNTQVIKSLNTQVITLQRDNARLDGEVRGLHELLDKELQNSNDLKQEINQLERTVDTLRSDLNHSHQRLVEESQTSARLQFEHAQLHKTYRRLPDHHG